MLPDSYLATTARRMGVPEMYIEDYCQDFRVEMWLKPNAPEKLVARSRAIDAVRHHCGSRRDRQPVYIDESFSGVAPDFTRDVIAQVDSARLLERLPPYMQREIVRVLADQPAMSASALSKARKRARELAS